MSVEKLLAALEKEAELREEAILEKAQAEAEAIITSGQKRANEIESQIAELARESGRKKAMAKAARERIAKRSARLSSAWKTTEKAFCLAEELYAEFMKTDRFETFIQDKYALAEKRIGPADKVSADPVTAKALLHARKHVDVDTNIKMGFIARAGPGSIMARFVFREALQDLWRKDAHIHHDTLFDEAGDAD